MGETSAQGGSGERGRAALGVDPRPLPSPVTVVDRARPTRADSTYPVRAPLVRWLRAFPFDGRRVLDVGCGERPYAELFAGAAEVVAFDRPGNPLADLQGSIESIPAPDARFDVVVCLQVLEHVRDPAAAVRELRRLVRPGGTVLASTHGVYPYHPNPEDLWRWTHAGLERLFLDNGEWSSLSVEAGAGAAATAGMVVGYLFEILCKRLHVTRLAVPLVVALNSGGEWLDARVPLLHDQRPGAISANYHVTAVASGDPASA